MTVHFIGAGPGDLITLRALLREHAVDVVVTKDSGGKLTGAKLTAARELSIPVVLVRRPPLPTRVAEVDGVPAARAWVLRS